MTRIRVAEPFDASGIVRLLDRVAQETPVVGVVPGSRPVGAVVQAMVQGTSRFWIGVDDGRIVAWIEVVRGMVPVSEHLATFGLVVDPTARRKGWGRRLVTTVHQWAAAERLEKLTISCWAANQPALALYTALGYREEGRRTGQFIWQDQQIDEILLARWAPWEELPP